jgi:hypothetical protein
LTGGLVGDFSPNALLPQVQFFLACLETTLSTTS